MGELPRVRRATVADVPTLTRMLACAYLDDPVAVWASPSAALRLRMLEGLYRARLEEMLAHREIWATDGLSSVAVWVPPGDHRTSVAQQAGVLRCLLHPRLLARAPLLALGNGAMRLRHPRGPAHWYLSLLATDPSERGRGLGAAVLQPVLERCDEEGVPIYLESSKESNVAFYARQGFRVTATFHLPLGPRMWAMWREPARERTSEVTEP